MAAAIGDPQRVGVRLSPFGQFLHTDLDPDTVALNLHIIEALTPKRPLYLSYVDARPPVSTDKENSDENEPQTSFCRAWKVLFSASTKAALQHCQCPPF